MTLERSLILIKPCAIPTAVDVMRKLFYAGFNLIQRKCFILNRDEILEFFTLAGNIDEYQADTQKSLASNEESTYMAICVSKKNAIEKLNQLFVDDDAIHASHCCSAAHREIKFFFPNLWTESIVHSSINDIMDCRIRAKVFPILTKSLCEVSERCPPPENVISELRTALILRNPMKPIIIEPIAPASFIRTENSNIE